jgi:anti-sigma regulatory factor (Ser/Thr protein kinase)
VLVLEGGPALGLGTDAACPVWVGHLAPGDAVIFCTDGVTEAFDAAGSAFGLERFRSVVASTGVDSVDTLPRRVEDAIERFSAGGAARDDMAVVALQFRPAGVTVDMEGDETWRLSVPSEPHALAPALRAIEGILRARDVPPAMIHDCVLASEELLANVMTHAYGGEVGREAHVEVRMPPEEIRIRIEDAGPLFDPFEAPEPDLEAPVAERPIGKLGLVLVQRLADHWDYARVGAANVHTLHWKRPAETGDGAFREMQRSADKEET